MKIVQVLFDQPGQSFSDISGMNTVITKTGSFKSTPPLTARTQNSVLIDSSNSLTISNAPIAKNSHEYEDFSISFYIKAGGVFSSEESVLYDSVSGAGITVKDSNIIFSLTDASNNKYSSRYKIPNIGKSYYIAASYSNKTMSLFVDGVAQAQQELPASFKFKSTTTLSLTSSVASSFILLDKIEIFNEALNSKYIGSEMDLDLVYQNPAQIMSLDDAAYFSFSKDIKPVKTGFVYGINKSMSTATVSGLEELYENYVTIAGSTGAGSGYFTDSVFITTVDNDSNNQIDWYGDSGGVEVSYNTDGSNTYIPLTNHSNIPGFTGGMFYYKVTISSQDLTLDKPAFTGMSFIVYDSKEFRSDNTLYSVNTDFNYYVGNDNNSLIKQSYENGLTTILGGISIADNTVRSIEFMYMPKDLSQTCLLDCGGSRYSWSSAGNITKTNISSIYVNGVNLYSQTSASNVFIPGIWHHVVITLSQDEASTLFLNQSKTGTLIGSNSGFAHLGIYDYDMSAKAITHYKHLTSRVLEATSSDSISIGSDSYSGYNVDKVVLSTQ